MTGVALDRNTSTLVVGANETLVATVSPTDATDKTVTWSSSDETKATVVNGKVTAIAEGTADITVTTTDGNKTAKCSYTITAE